MSALSPQITLFSYLALTALDLFSRTYSVVENFENEISLIVHYVPTNSQVFELDEMGVWDLFLEIARQELSSTPGDLDPRIVEFELQLAQALADHRQSLKSGLEFLTPALIVQDAIADIFTPDVLNHNDEAYVGLIVRYIDFALWESFLAKKNIQITSELLLGMTKLCNGMGLLRDAGNLQVCVLVRTKNVDAISIEMWLEAKATLA